MKFLGIHIILNDTWEEYKETEEKAKKLAKEVENLDGRLLLALERGNKLNDKNNELEKEILDLGKNLSDVKKELTTSRDSNKKLMSSVREKVEKIKDLEKEIKELKEENKEREDYIGRLLEQNKDLSGKVSSLNAAKGGYVKKIKDLENEISYLKKEKEDKTGIIFIDHKELIDKQAVEDYEIIMDKSEVAENTVDPVPDFEIPEKDDLVGYHIPISEEKEDKPSEAVYVPKNKKKNRH